MMKILPTLFPRIFAENAVSSYTPTSILHAILHTETANID